MLDLEIELRAQVSAARAQRWLIVMSVGDVSCKSHSQGKL